MSYGKGFKGSKYVAGRPTKEIARFVRQDIKDGIKSGEFPKGLKCSIRYRSFSGGSSIECDVVALPSGFKVYNDEALSSYSQEYLELQGKLKALVQAYRYDDSDSMVDYFDVNFYGGYFDLDYRFEAELRKRKSLTA